MRSIALVALPVSILAAALVTAGPLTPPAGPVASTHKTLSEVEPRTAIQSLAGAPPYVISQPGSYYLTGNITAVSGQRGIIITADNVTVDLNGFAMIGNLNGDDAIFCNFRRNLTVRNGTIRDWVKEAIDGFGTYGAHVQNLTVDNCPAGYGIILGDAAMVSDCTSTRTGAGFIVGNKSTLTRCTAELNNGLGFQAGVSTSLLQCTADANTGDGFVAGLGSNISNCIARTNTLNGFVVDGWANLDASTAVGNAQYGVYFSAPGSTIGAMVTNCNIAANALGGIVHLGSGATVRGCNISRNPGSGLSVGSNSFVADNTFSENGSLVGDPPPAFQVYTGGSGNRFDNNHFYSTASITGLYLTGADNLIVRNTFVGAGPSMSLSNPNNETALTAVAPGQNFTNTNAWANFKY